MRDKQEDRKFRQIIEKVVVQKASEIDAEELQELEEDLEYELLDPAPPIDDRLPLPADDEVVTSNNSTPLSYYYQNVWTYNNMGRIETLTFGKEFVTGGLCVTGPQTEPLHNFIKLLTYYRLPGKDPYSVVSSFKSTKERRQVINSFCGYLYLQGYLIGDINSCKTLETISVDALRAEIRSRIASDSGLVNVYSFARGVAYWAYISKIAALPPSLTASFSPYDFLSDGLASEVSRYAAKLISPYQAIEYTDLVRMLKTAYLYMREFADDLLFLNRQLDKARVTNNNFERKNIFDEIRSHKYHKNNINESNKLDFKPKLDNEVFSISVFEYDYIYLEGAAVFMLLIWTALRRSDLGKLASNALIIDSVQVDTNEDIYNKVKLGNVFDLKVLVSKPSKNFSGTYKIIPIPRVAAEAFAVLYETQRFNRNNLNSGYLFALGKQSGTNSQNGFSCGKKVAERLAQFCNAAGVERQLPHKCRKTLPTLLINDDPTCIELIKDLLGHRSITTTRDYLMSLPGVAEAAREMMLQQQRERVVAILTDVAGGKVAGRGLDRTLDAVAANPQAFKGSALPRTINILLDALVRNSNFFIERTPAAWCLRFPASIPWDAPCLPPPELRESMSAVVPNHEKCVPHLCKFAGHTTADKDRAKASLSWAKKCSTESRTRASLDYFNQEVTYWEGVVHQLEYGRHDVASLQLIEQSLEAEGVA